MISDQSLLLSTIILNDEMFDTMAENCHSISKPFDLSLCSHVGIHNV